MTVTLLIIGAALLCATIYVVAVFSPRRSRRMQARADGAIATAERVGEENGGRAGDAAARGAKTLRRAVDSSAKKGRRAHQRMRRSPEE